MSSNGKYRYGNLDAGSYFGDISLMSGHNNEFGYFYNTGTSIDVESPTVNLLMIEGNKFLKLCEDHKVCKDVFTRRAK